MNAVELFKSRLEKYPELRRLDGNYREAVFNVIIKKYK